MAVFIDELSRLDPGASPNVQHQMSHDEECVQAPSFVGGEKHVFKLRLYIQRIYFPVLK